MQVLICTYGTEGIARVAEANHPQVEGVSWLVSWQMPEGAELPQALQRSDFEIVRTDTKGLSLNRNIALQHATDEIVVISDDDIAYTPQQLARIRSLFEENPGLDIITYKYQPTAECYRKEYYSDKPFDLRHPARGYYLTSFEMALRLSAQRRADVWYDERFGIGSQLFLCGEEQLFLHRLLKRGLQGRFFPETLCTHTGGATTSERLASDPRTVEANAATKAIMHPATWLLRQLSCSRKQNKIPFTKYMAASIMGACKLLKSWITGYPKTHTCC